MKTDGQIRHKLQQVTYRHLQRGIRTAMSCRPENCEHNGSVAIPTGTVRFCTLREDDNGSFLPCDESFGGLDQAAECQDFRCTHTKESVKASLTTFLQSSDVPMIAARYPDIAALLWILGDEKLAVPDQNPDPEPHQPPAPQFQYVTLGETEHTHVSINLAFHRAVVFHPTYWTTSIL